MLRYGCSPRPAWTRTGSSDLDKLNSLYKDNRTIRPIHLTFIIGLKNNKELTAEVLNIANKNS